MAEERRVNVGYRVSDRTIELHGIIDGRPTFDIRWSTEQMVQHIHQCINAVEQLQKAVGAPVPKIIIPGRQH